ncbi:MAG: MBL fold metallo-hydrolase [Williamsia sp.]|nr:MBL fold metallo-hydrolase [Williamsia sp.]
MNTQIKGADIDLFAAAPGVWGIRDLFVNLYIVINSADNSWVLVDAGLKTAAPKVKQAVDLLFGAQTRPTAIVLTHGHFDHVGSVKTLAEEWDVPVYAHELELPYLTGLSKYPPPDPAVDGGLMAEISGLYPRGPIDLGMRVKALPSDGTVPFLPDWTWLHTPGHAPGHISLYRKEDGVLIAGDAFVTTKAESALYTILQKKKISGPPKYFTPDWQAAAASLRLLDGLHLDIVATGHGRPMQGSGMRKSIHNLAQHFQQLAVPRQGRYVAQPAQMDQTGVVWVPPNAVKPRLPVTKAIGITAGFLALALFIKSGAGDTSKKKRKPKLKLKLKTAKL